jgi:DNA-binding SARP family transcriptional activator
MRTEASVIESTRLVLLGAARVEHDGQRLPLTEALVRLLAYLALDGGPVRRSSLAGTLWPDCTEQRALGNLRSALWRIHRVEPGLVEIRASTLMLGTDIGVDARDVVVASRALLQPQRDDDVAAFLWLIDDAQLLPGWDDHWVLFERERQRQLRLHALETLAELLCRRGDCGVALDAALAALRIEPLRESAHRAVIRIHQAEGNLVEARRQYEACARLLWDELGLAPSPATRQLFRSPARRGPLPVPAGQP